jgi:methylated-DNA-[protein]-cysteine S-methyltransferase
METPEGPFTTIVDNDGAVLASGWTTDTHTLLALVHPTLRGEARPRTDLGAATKALGAYLDGDLAALDLVTVRQQSGGEFLNHAWGVLRAVPAGEPVSYTEFAALAGRPTATRAAAQACARNAAALFVPCHRVLRSDGTLGGFRWGLDVKRWLLEFESDR